MEPEAQERWQDPKEQDRMVEAALQAARDYQAATAPASNVRDE